jgi:CubicO group peptidase (beta-lactamase class C family)
MKIIRLFPSIASLVFLALLTSCNTKAPASKSLPRSTPEAEGVSSEALIIFLDSVAAGSHEFHSIMIVRHGKVIAEGWWDPYNPELRHTLYSTSKSFTSTAVGLAVNEKLLTVNDRVVSFFPDQLPDTVSPFLAEMTVKDLLTMSAGQASDPTGAITSTSKEWVRSFLAVPVLKEPGTEFLYNSMATFMLSAIVQKVTGEKIANYLRPRLFDPLGIEGYDWEESPEGINSGGWGLRIKTEDMAKFGQLYLQKGSWNGAQIIPAAWVEEATTFKIDQAPDAPSEIKEKSDWTQGYCYQFWRSRNNAYRADGAFGQYIIVMPDLDAVIAITAESPDMQDELNMVWNYILPAFKDEALPVNSEAADRLKERLASLALPEPEKKTEPAIVSLLSGKIFRLEENNQRILSLSLLFRSDTCLLSLVTDDHSYKIPFGSGGWVTSETDLAGPSLIRRPGVVSVNRVAGSYGWKDEGTLELILRYIESPHHIKITCSFEGDTVVVQSRLSNPPGYDLKPIKGIIAK